MLKRLAVSSLALALLSGAVWAAPFLVNFQGKLLDPATNNPKNGSITMTFRIYDAQSGGNTLWGPESQALTVTNGVFSGTVFVELPTGNNGPALRRPARGAG